MTVLRRGPRRPDLLPPRTSGGDHHQEEDAAEVRRQRAETNDQVLRTQQGQESSLIGSFEL